MEAAIMKIGTIGLQRYLLMFASLAAGVVFCQWIG